MVSEAKEFKACLMAHMHSVRMNILCSDLAKAMCALSVKSLHAANLLCLA